MYAVKEIYYTLQGEGFHTGRAAVFCRFAGCNLWSGQERDRHDAICQFCDTDFVGVEGPGGGRFTTADEVAQHVDMVWPNTETTSQKMVVCTGGEPLLQLDDALIDAFHRRGFYVAIETNGTLPVPRGIDWICVSPKAQAELVVRSGDELKLVFPQCGDEPHMYRRLQFQYWWLQPMDGPSREQNLRRAIDYCLAHPEWRLSLQTHKLIGIP